MVSTLYLEFDMKCGMCLHLSLKKDRHFIIGREKNSAAVRPEVFTRVTLQINYSGCRTNKSSFYKR